MFQITALIVETFWIVGRPNKDFQIGVVDGQLPRIPRNRARIKLLLLQSEKRMGTTWYAHIDQIFSSELNNSKCFVRRCATSFMTGPDQLSQCDRHNNSFINLLRTDSDGKVLPTDSQSYCQRLCPPRQDADCWLRWGVDTRRLEHGDR